MNFLVIVNESPWGSPLALSAYRFVLAAAESGVRQIGVYFLGDGVYNAIQGETSDAVGPDLASAWAELAARGIRLSLCSSSRLRRLGEKPDGPFRDSGLTEMIEAMRDSDRVVTF